MISLDQVELLEQKVESAVEKIKQLEGENAALRNKCSELTNALSAKTEQLATFESEQKTIESGIIKAIDRLNSIEHSVLKTAGAIAAKEEVVEPEPVPQVFEENLESSRSERLPEPVEGPADEPVAEVPVDEPIEETASVVTDLNFDQMTPVEEPEEPPFEEVPVEEVIEEPVEDEADDAEQDPESKDNLGFDIF